MSNEDNHKFSSQFIEEEEDFFLDDDSVDHEEELRLSQEEINSISENKEESFRRMLAGPSTNKVYRL
jgi:DNA polymerase kappa